MPDSSQPRPTAAPSFGPLPRADLVSLLRADQRHRWQRGERVAVEAYVDRMPFLSEDSAALLDLVVAEVELRAEEGEPCSLDEYKRRFPQLAGPLVWRLALHRSTVGSVLSNGNGQVPLLPAPPEEEPEEGGPFEPIPLGSAITEQPPPSPPVAEEPMGPVVRTWQWCRRHPAPATVLTAAAACVLFGAVAAPFAGRASSTAPPTDASPPVVDSTELRLARDRADRAEREVTTALAQAAAEMSARDDALRLKAAAEIEAARSSAALAELRTSIDGFFEEAADGDPADNSTPNALRDRLLTAAKAHYEAVVKKSGDDLAQRAERGHALVRLGQIAEIHGQAAEAARQFRNAVEDLSAPGATANFQPTIATAQYRLGRLERQAGHLPEAESAGRKAVEVWDAVCAKGGNDVCRRELARSLSGLGDSLSAARRFDDAIAAYRRAIDTWQMLKTATAADVVLTWEHLADCLAAAGQPDLAADARRQVVDQLRQQADRTPDDLRVAQSLARNLSALNDLKREPAAGPSAYEESVAAWERVVRLRPAAGSLTNLAKSLERLSEVQRQLGQVGPADRTADRAIAVRERLIAEHPGQAESESALAAGYSARGERFRDRIRDDDSAAAEFRRAAPLLESLVNRSADNRDYVSRLAINEMCLALLDLRRRKIEPARTGFKQALARLDKLSATDEVSVNRAVCCVNLGQLAVMDRQPKDAGDWFDRAEQLLKPLAEHPDWKSFVSAVLADCARGREQIGGRPRTP